MKMQTPTRSARDGTTLSRARDFQPITGFSISEYLSFAVGSVLRIPRGVSAGRCIGDKGALPWRRDTMVKQAEEYTQRFWDHGVR